MKTTLSLLSFAMMLSCYSQQNVVYDRVNSNGSWGFVDNHQQTVIPLGIYEFLNPLDEQNMILATKNGKQGYIDIHENILIPFEYDDLGVFTDNGLAPAQKNGKMGAINRKGETAIAFTYEHLGFFYKSGLAVAQKNGKYGFLDKTGKEVIPIIHEKVDQTMDDDIVLIMKNNKWALFSNKGKQLTDYLYDEVGDDSYNPLFKNGLAIAQKDEKPTYLDKQGKEVIEAGKYDYAEAFTTSGFAIVSRNSKYGIINISGKEVIPLQYDNIEHPRSYSNILELFILKQNGKLKILDTQLKLITEEILEYKWDKTKTGDEYSDQLLIKNNLNKYGVIKEDGSVIIPFTYDELAGFSGRTIAIAKKNGKYGIIDIENKVISAFVNDTIDNHRRANTFLMKSEGLFTVANIKGNNISTFEYDDMKRCYYDEDNQFIVEKNGKYGIVNIMEKVVLPVIFDDISNWVEYGPDAHFVTLNKKKGMYSRTGKELMPPVYDDLYYYIDELIIAKKNNKAGIITINDEILIPFDYDEILVEWGSVVLDHKEPEIYVLKDKKYQQLNLGNKVIKSSVSEDEINMKFKE